MDETVEISIVIPVWNVEKYIARCLDSIISQLIGEIAARVEVVCVDDASTDNTLEIIEQYKEEIQRFCIIHNEKNLGQGAARNMGINVARGRFVWFVDADDRIATDSIRNILDAIRTVKADVYWGDADVNALEERGTSFDNKHDIEFFYEDGMEMIDFLRNKRTGEIMDDPVWNKIFSRDFLISNHLVFAEGVFFEDLLFVCEMISCVKTSAVMNATLYHYYERKGSTMQVDMTTDSKYLFSYVWLIDNLACLIRKEKKTRVREYIERKLGAVIGVAQTLYREMNVVDRFYIDNYPDLKWVWFVLAGVCNSLQFPFKLSPQIFSKLKQADKTYIYGSGIIGKSILELLENSSICVEGFILTNIINQPSCLDYPIYPASEIGTISISDKTVIIIATSKERYAKEMRETAIAGGLSENQLLSYSEMIK